MGLENPVTVCQGFGEGDEAVPCSGNVSLPFAVPPDIPSPCAWRNLWLCLGFSVRDLKPTHFGVWDLLRAGATLLPGFSKLCFLRLWPRQEVLFPLSSSQTEATTKIKIKLAKNPNPNISNLLILLG